ncbi:MAG: 3-dehydroquinate synthase [Acidobacteriota bacterium]
MQEKFEIKIKDCSILFNCPFREISKYLPNKSTFIITDENVNRLYRNSFPSFREKIVIGSGERVKTLQTIEMIYEKLLVGGADRSSFILAVGGGVVCDIIGFAASTYMRGIDFAFVPTPLLAQVDAAIGGKNGVNFMGYKNIVGVFNQPVFVLIDPSFLPTLSDKEIFCGFSEVIKSAAIADAEFFSYLEKYSRQALELESRVAEKIIRDTVKIKVSIVEKDEKEKGERKKLNFGHSFAHSLEKICRLSHGESVSVGMVLAAELSVRKKNLARADFERLRSLLIKYRLPVSLSFQKKAVFETIRKDKKKKRETIDFILLKSIGEASIENIEFKELMEVMDDLYQPGN